MDLKKQLKNLKLSDLKIKNGDSLEQELRYHAKVLKDCLEYEMNVVYESYFPVVYKRKRDFYRSLQIDDVIRIDYYALGFNSIIKLTFNDKVMHPNFNGGKSDVSVLLNEGWKWKNSKVKIPYLSEREGTHFLERGIKRYQEKVDNPFKVRLTINDEVREF